MRLGIRPPGVKADWDDMGAMNQALAPAFDQVASHDEDKRDVLLAGASHAH